MLTYFTIHKRSIQRSSREKRNLCFFFILSLSLFRIGSVWAEAITTEHIASFIPRVWTKPGELTEEEKAKLAKEVIENAIIVGKNSSSSGGANAETGVSSVVSIDQKPSLIVDQPKNDSEAVVTPQTRNDAISVQQTTVAALKEIGPAPTTLAYQKRYQELQTQWKTEIAGKSMSGGYALFFQQDDFLNADSSQGTQIKKSTDDPYGSSQKVFDDGADGSPEALSSGNLTTNAMQALMLRFLSDNPPLDIAIDSINVASAVIDSPAGNAIKVDNALIKSVVLTPALGAFKNGKTLYASLMRLESEGKGQYVVVVLDKHGHVCIIDPAVKEKAYKDKLLTAVIKSLNTVRTAQDLSFTPIKSDIHIAEQNVVNTGIAGPDADNSNSGIYAFTYWAGLIANDKLDAYKSINGAVTEETSALVGYELINMAAVYSKKVVKTPGKRGGPDYEENIREWLRGQLKLN